MVTTQVYALKCRDCVWESEDDTQESAAAQAKHHICEDIGDVDPQPHADHVVVTTLAWITRMENHEH